MLFDEAGGAEAAAMERALAAQTSAEGDGDEGAAAFMSLDELAAQQLADGAREVLAEGLAESLGPEVAAARGLLSDRAMQLLQVGQRWAGPGHWKFRGAAANTGGGTASSTEEQLGGTAKKSKKAYFLIDFSKRGEVCASLEGGPVDKRGSVLSNAALSKASASSDNTLPHDCHFSIEALEALFDKPTHSIRYSKKVGRRSPVRAASVAANASGTIGADTGAHANLEDCDFDAASELDGAAAWASDAASQPEGEHAAAAPRFSLVAAPTKTAKVAIGYAKVAKQVNIKALKKARDRAPAALHSHHPPPRDPTHPPRCRTCGV